jgi:hypothetical protein
MEWPELDRISDQLHRLLHRGAFRGLPEVAVEGDHMMDAELLVRITLADISHVRDWDVGHPLTPMSDYRRRELAEDGYRLLGLVEAIQSL